MAIQSATSSQQISAGVVSAASEPTTGTGVASAVAEDKPKVRRLTPGEIEMAKLVFKDAIAYDDVRVHDETYIPFQDEDTAMTPNGEIYFAPKNYQEDFSQQPNWRKHWFMHEMTHVWQHQLGYPVKLRGAIRIGLSYKYDLAEDKLLKDYNMEAQGDLVADYFVLKFLNDSASMSTSEIRYANNLLLYEKVLRDFIADPKNPDSQPGGVPHRPPRAHP